MLAIALVSLVRIVTNASGKKRYLESVKTVTSQVKWIGLMIYYVITVEP